MEPKDVAHLLNTGLDKHLKNTPRLLNSAILTSADNKEFQKGVKRESLTTKKAVKLLLEGRLKKKVCRYCLDLASPLSELDQVLQIAGSGVLYKISIRDMVASFHPFMVADDSNFPNKICNKCLNRTISSYLFTQQCERSERALRNCFEDMYNKVDKLDPLEPPLKRRGKPKKHPNCNILYTEHEKVIDYAEPIINIINSGSELINENNIKVGDQFECLKCCQTFPNIASLVSHEKIHPKTMFYHCRHCGKSFTKRNLVRNHKKTHEPKKQKVIENTDFQCRECGFVSVNVNEHLQHVEKHKFQMVMQHLIDRDMDKLCTVCLDRNVKLVDMDEMVCLNGGYPEMMGDRSLYNILGSTVPDMNILHNYTGTKICEKCLNHAITSYVFIQQTQYVRNRIKICISEMLNSLNKVETTEGNLFVEISQCTIMPTVDQEFDENLLLKDEEIDESKLKIEVLEDEFRLKSDSEESEPESSEVIEKQDTKDLFSLSEILDEPEKVIKDVFDFTGLSTDSDEAIDNPAKKTIITYDKRNQYNGIYQNDKNCNSMNISEFLTFKKKRNPTKRFYSCKFTCPLCSKHFVSDYFLKRHILKHVHKKVKCTMCDNVFKSKFYLYEHIKRNHILKQTKFTPCKVCGRTFVSLKKLDRHLQSHLKKECQLCSKFFLSQTHYDSHMERHVTKLRLLKQRRAQNCSFCEKECANDNELSVHVNKVHLQIKPYSCDMCERQFYTESNLCSHMKVHNLYSKENCQFCGKNLKCRKDLVVHLRKHIGVQPHACPLCDQTFYTGDKVKRHMSINHGGAYCCKLCKCILKTKSRLKLHINRAHNII